MASTSVKRFSALSRSAVDGGAAKGKEGENHLLRIAQVRLAACRSKASSISRSTSFGMGSPEYSHILGYMLMEVKPGMVLISLM